VVTKGHASSLRSSGLLVAGKTGTSSATMDTWFVGYTSRSMITTWIGDDRRERPLGYKDAAFMLTVPMAARFLSETTAGQPLRDIPWERPAGVRANDTGGNLSCEKQETVARSSRMGFAHALLLSSLVAAADPLPDVPAKTQQTGGKPQAESDRDRHVGKGSPWDKTKTGRALRKAAAQGDANAQYRLGLLYAGAGWTGPNRYGVLQDFEEAVFWWKKAADQGNDQAQFSLGRAYTEGEGVPQDHVEAARWYRESADQGNSWAQFSLGFAYANGMGVPQDHVEAARWYRKAADQGGVEAQGLLGLAYATGMGVPQDYAEAARWYRKAADQGNTTAQFLLGSACAKGEGVPQDYPEAVRWWKKAADHGDVEAQLNLGVSYAKGEGVPQDYEEAYFWANLASALNKDAKKEAIPKLRDSIGAALPREQLSATQKRCRQWMDAFEKRKAQK